MADKLTARSAIELVGHEAIVLEAYLDNASPPNWTWGIGVTDASGHNVGRYKDHPSTVERALEIFVWLLRTKYAPAVVRAFTRPITGLDAVDLTEAEFAAALSFHYNTGAILTTNWVTLVRENRRSAARAFLETHYLNGGDLKARRMKEAALFFDGLWSNDGHATIFPVRKPSYQPDFRHGQRVDIRADMDKALAA